jgi:hypothetical protein
VLPLGLDVEFEEEEEVALAVVEMWWVAAEVVVVTVVVLEAQAAVQVLVGRVTVQRMEHPQVPQTEEVAAAAMVLVALVMVQ